MRPLTALIIRFRLSAIWLNLVRPLTLSLGMLMALTRLVAQPLVSAGSALFSPVVILLLLIVPLLCITFLLLSVSRLGFILFVVLLSVVAALFLLLLRGESVVGTVVISLVHDGETLKIGEEVFKLLILLGPALAADVVEPAD